MRIKEIKICMRIIMTNSAIEFLRLSLKFSVYEISLAFKTFQGKYGTLGVRSHIILYAAIHRGSSILPKKI